MRRKLTGLAATLLLVFAAMFAFATSTTEVCAQGGSCQTQCRVAYDRCVRNASNPGGLNQCGKAYNRCLERCG